MAVRLTERLPSMVHRKIFGTVCLLALLSWLTPALAAIYYVDPATGVNTNNGTSAGTAWQNPPGTRTTNNGGFISTTWGTVATGHKMQCGDTILLKGGATQTSTQGGAWRIDNGPGKNGTGYYTTGCPENAPITMRVATAAEWSGSSGHFTLDGTGITATCLVFCGDASALVHVQDVDTLLLGGNSASQRLIIRAAAGGGGTTHNLMLTSTNTPPNAASRFTGQWLELANAQNDGVSIGRAQNFVIRDTLAHDNGWSGFSTGLLNDNRVVNGGFQDVEAFRNGPQSGPLGDQFQFLGCESCYVVRAKSHDGYLRGLNYGNIGSFGGSDMFLLIRDSAFWHNGLSSDNNNVYQSGPCWSGDDSAGGQRQRGVMQRSIVAQNREGGGPCAYGQGWAEVWNSVWWHNGYDKSVYGFGDIVVGTSADIDYVGVFNSIVQKRSDNVTWGDAAPSNFGTKRCPVSDYNLFLPVSANTETLSNFECTGTDGFTRTDKTYASPPAFIGSHTLLGATHKIDFVATHDMVYSNNDFHLQSTSSAIDAGTFMFRADGAGSGTTMQVLGNGGSNDPRHYFLSPTSYYQATPDTIQIAGCGPVSITSMTATSITFTPSCASWANGAGIHLPWSGTRPDMGVYEYLSGVAILPAPANLHVVP